MHARKWMGTPQPCPPQNESRARLPRGWPAGSLLVHVFVVNGLFDHIIKRLRYLGGSFRRQCYIEPISMLLWASRDHAELQKCRHALSQLKRQAIPQKGFFLKHASDGLHKKISDRNPASIAKPHQTSMRTLGTDRADAQAIHMITTITCSTAQRATITV